MLYWVSTFWNSWVWSCIFLHFLNQHPPLSIPSGSCIVCGFFKLCLNVAFFFCCFFLLLLSFSPLQGAVMKFLTFLGILICSWCVWFIFIIELQRRRIGSCSSLPKFTEKTPSFACLWISLGKIKVSQISDACWHTYICSLNYFFSGREGSWGSPALCQVQWCTLVTLLTVAGLNCLN